MSSLIVGSRIVTAEVFALTTKVDTHAAARTPLPAARSIVSRRSSQGGRRRHRRRRRVVAEEEVDDHEPASAVTTHAIWSGSWKEWSNTRLPSVVVPVSSASAAAICVPLAGKKSTPATAVQTAIM